jgi:hypothetical protein
VKKAIAATVALMAVGGFVWAAQEGGKAQEPPQRAKASKEHEALKVMEGSWDYVMKTTAMGHDMHAAEFKVSEVCSPVGDFWMVFDIKTPDMMGAPWHGHGSIGYDPSMKKYTGHFINSHSPLAMTGEGTMDAAGKVMTMNWASHGPDGKPATMREVFENKDKDHSTMTMYMNGADGKEMVLFSINYTRKK